MGKIRRAGPERRRIYQELDAIVIDEISMVRADLLDYVDRFLKVNLDETKPFGGLQMVFIGDPYQLPPVMTPADALVLKNKYASQYFFDSTAFQETTFECVELEKIYRQKDESFIHLLNAIRNNTITEEQLVELNQRFEPDFEPPAESGFITLTTRNDDAERINEKRLDQLPGKAFSHSGTLTGGFKRDAMPAPVHLSLKPGAQVMLLNNDSAGRWYNGSLAKVASIEPADDVIFVDLEDGSEESVKPYRWNMSRLFFNKETQSIDTSSAGSFTQYPLKLAWAITIHKSQGKTFDNAVIDFGSGTFVHGQAYVALSRCRSLAGLTLKKRFEKRHVITDWRVPRYFTNKKYAASESAFPLSEKKRTITKAIESNTPLDIVYLKANDEQSQRIVEPIDLGLKSYMGKKFLCLTAFCRTRQAERHFKIDRILAINPLKPTKK